MCDKYMLGKFFIVSHETLASQDLQKKKIKGIPYLYLDKVEFPYQ